MIGLFGLEDAMSLMLTRKCNKLSENGLINGDLSYLWQKQKLSVSLGNIKKHISTLNCMDNLWNIVNRCLGVWPDEKLTWKVYLEKNKGKCKKVINIVRCLSGQEWGVDKNLYKT